MTLMMHVLVPTSRRSDLLKRTLDGLVACEKPKGFAGVLVVENGGASGVEQLVAEYAGPLAARYLYEPAGNKNRAINRGLGRIESGLVVLYDDDVRIASGSLMAYHEAAIRWPEAPFFGGWCGCDYEIEPEPAVRPLLPLSARGWCLARNGEPIDQPHALGFNWAVRTTVVRQMGGFTEDRGPGTAVIVGDEYEMQQRMIAEVGPGRFVDEARVWHYIPAERCAADWLIERGYHYGVAKAMQQRTQDDRPGVPWWVRRRLWTSTVKWLLARAVPNASYRLRTSYGRQINRGLLAGYRRPWSSA